ncbi:MAG: flagellar basal body L-ring protein FlgH [Rhodospirillaceae bacterium]|nr:MAG: flagellar basal body L-ring protein FlgH [Rhodospirillaceae bacterium]
MTTQHTLPSSAHTSRISLLRLALILLSSSALTACGATERLSRVGEPPAISPITNPTEMRDYHPVSMPMPTPAALAPSPNSLWRPGARAFFKDQRAKVVGDVLTVNVNIADTAALANDTRRTRQNVSENASIPSLLGISSAKLGIGTANPSVSATAGSDFEGKGTIARSEAITISLAAVVLQTLPNGNLAIAGRQEVRVNTELRELQVAGVIRPEDIAADNTIPWNKIAEARVSYGGRGILSDVQQPRYGQQVFDIIFPF